MSENMYEPEHGLFDVSYAAAWTLGRQIPATQVKPGDVGMLSLRYVDGQPVLVVSGGTAIPARLRVVDASGNTVAAYAAGQAPESGSVAQQTSAITPRGGGIQTNLGVDGVPVEAGTLLGGKSDEKDE